MDNTVIILLMMATMMVILIIFAFILVLGGADSVPADDGTVVVRIDKEHAQEMADIFGELLCDRFEYNSRHERQRDQDIVGDVLNLTPPPMNGPGRDLFRKIVSYNELDDEEKQKVIIELQLHGIPIDVSKLEGGDEEEKDEYMSEDDSAGINADPVEKRSSTEAKGTSPANGLSPKGPDTPSVNSEETLGSNNKEDSGKSQVDENGGKDREPKAEPKRTRVKPVRTAESDREKGKRATANRTTPKPSTPEQVSVNSGLEHSDDDFGDREFGLGSI